MIMLMLMMLMFIVHKNYKFIYPCDFLIFVFIFTFHGNVDFLFDCVPWCSLFACIYAMMFSLD